MSETDAIPEFKKSAGGDSEVGITNMSALTSGPGIKSMGEVLAIVLVAVVIIGGTTLVELFVGFGIGAVVGLILAAVITQFPFAEKIITPYILLLVTTPMLALVPLLILRFGFGYEPRIIAVALAAGPMVMINAATGFRRVDRGKIALARSYGASTLQIFWKVRAPMALPMIFVGLMVGSIFGLLTAVGAEMVGGGFGLGNRLTSYSSMIQMPQFFAVVLILSILGILIYVLFFLLGKKYASWEA